MSSITWQDEKKEIANEQHLERRVRAQDVLKEIERAHFANTIASTKQESVEKFDQWLVSQGFPKRDDKRNSIFIQNNTKTGLSKIGDEQQNNENIEDESNKTSQQNRRSKSKKKTIKKTEKDWNYSTKAAEKEYITDLNDFYPRDPLTQLPENIDLLMLNRELRGKHFESFEIQNRIYKLTTKKNKKKV